LRPSTVSVSGAAAAASIRSNSAIATALPNRDECDRAIAGACIIRGAQKTG
jgi:hypothetical protein